MIGGSDVQQTPDTTAAAKRKRKERGRGIEITKKSSESVPSSSFLVDPVRSFSQHDHDIHVWFRLRSSITHAVFCPACCGGCLCCRFESLFELSDLVEHFLRSFFGAGGERDVRGRGRNSTRAANTGARGGWTLT